MNEDNAPKERRATDILLELDEKMTSILKHITMQNTDQKTC